MNIFRFPFTIYQYKNKGRVDFCQKVYTRNWSTNICETQCLTLKLERKKLSILYPEYSGWKYLCLISEPCGLENLGFLWSYDILIVMCSSLSKVMCSVKYFYATTVELIPFHFSLWQPLMAPTATLWHTLPTTYCQSGLFDKIWESLVLTKLTISMRKGLANLPTTYCQSGVFDKIWESLVLTKLTISMRKGLANLPTTYCVRRSWKTCSDVADLREVLARSAQGRRRSHTVPATDSCLCLGLHAKTEVPQLQ